MSHSSSNPADSWFGRPPPDFARLPAQPRPEPASQLSDIVINECLNLEAEGEIHEAAARLRRAAASDPGIIERFNITRRVLGVLETEVPVGPDLTARIIAGVDERRPFLPRRARRHVSTTRLIAASGVLAALAVAALVQWQPPAAYSPPPSGMNTATVISPGNLLGTGSASPALIAGDPAASVQKPRLSFGNSDSYGNGKWAASPGIAPGLTMIGPPASGPGSPQGSALAQTAPGSPTLLSPAPNASVTRPLLWDARPDGLAALLGLRQNGRPAYIFAMPEKQPEPKKPAEKEDPDK